MSKRKAKKVIRKEPTVRVVRTLVGENLDLLVESAKTEEDYVKHITSVYNGYYTVDVYAKREYE